MLCEKSNSQTDSYNPSMGENKAHLAKFLSPALCPESKFTLNSVASSNPLRYTISD